MVKLHNQSFRVPIFQAYGVKQLVKAGTQRHRKRQRLNNRATSRRARNIACSSEDPPHRRRKVAARRQPIPELVQVVRKISLKVRNRLAVNTSRSLVGSNPLICFPHLPFRNRIRLCSIHEDPPVAGCPRSRAEQRNPFAPAPLQDLQHYYGLLRPCAPLR